MNMNFFSKESYGLSKQILAKLIMEINHKLFLPILLPIVHRHQLPNPEPFQNQSHKVIQLLVFLLPATISVSIYVADCVEYEVQVWVLGILMESEGDLVFRADLVADGHADTI